MNTGIFFPEIDLHDEIESKIKQIGNNTGNNVFWHALRHLLDLEKIPYNYKEQGYDLNKLEAVIITDLIWIRQGENFNYLEQLLNELTVPLIPISVGLQAHDYNIDFQLSKSTVNLLKRIEERATIGIRGEYTASILKKYGINNFSVIGCPSMYYWNNPNLRILDNIDVPRRLLVNFKTFYNKLNQKEKHFLSYSADRNATFIEQTIHEMKPEQVNDEAYYAYVAKWLSKNKKIFFSIESWLKETCTYDFSIGARFHGNVVSLWNNIISLFLIVDSRTKELTEHFQLPALNINDFDRFKPMEYYYDKADYSAFNQIYSKRFEEFKTFLDINKIKMKNDLPQIQFAGTKLERLRYIEKLTGMPILG